MAGAAAAPLLALLDPGAVCGTTAALVGGIIGSDFRPSEYPSAKKSAHTPTRPKNITSSLPVPRVISVSCDEAIDPFQATCGARLARLLFYAVLFLCSLSRRRVVAFSQQLLQAREKVHGHGEDHSRILFHTNLSQSLQIAQLHADRLSGQQMSCIHQPLRRRKFALSVNNLRPLLTLSLGLFGHGTQHRLRHVDLLHLDVGHFHSPRRGVRVENAL